MQNSKDKGQLSLGFTSKYDDLIKEFEEIKNQYQNEPDKQKKDKLREKIEELILQIFEEKIKHHFPQLKSIEEKYTGISSPSKREELITQEKKSLYKKLGFDLEQTQKDLIAYTEGRKPKNFFLWDVYFAEVFTGDNPGFDIVIANPPYGIRLENVEVILPTYNYFDRQKNSASFFIELGSKITNNEGIITYIVPKSLLFSEGWRKTRELIGNRYTLLFTIDVSKAFENVLLEQIIISFTKKQSDSNYYFYIGDGWNSEIKICGNIKKTLVEKLDILPNYLESKKLHILGKIQSQSIPLSHISKTFRGLPYQKRISNDGMPVLRGKNIGKYVVYGKIERINLSDSDLNRKKVKEILRPKIVSQNIVAHILNPFDRIIIMATIDRGGILTFDTVMNTFLTNEEFFLEYILAILNSKLASWFYYWFVYNRAIRTMHFDGYYMGKLPAKRISKSEQQFFVNLVNKILSLTEDKDYLESPQKQAKVKQYQRQIDQMVYKLYGLTEDEINIVEGRK